MSDRAKRGPDKGYAETYDDGRLSAPAALRNRDVIVQTLVDVAPSNGRALEIASGTGEHVIRFASAMPGLTWQPTDPAADRRASIQAWAAAEPADNLLPPLDLNACATGWSAEHHGFDLIFLANLLHLVTETEARTCLAEMALALAPGGRAAVYGPFLRDGQTTSDGDAAFDARLRAEIPGAGYKDLAWVTGVWQGAGLAPAAPHPMPANNLLLLAQKPADPAVT